MSQFTIYRSSDSGSPSLYGSTGSLIGVLDACLVNGYSSKPGAGWSKPFANTSSFTSSFNTCIGAWKQPSGSGFYLFVNDGGPNGTALYKESWATGWENLVGMSASVANTVGTGSGQFPLPAQLLTTGHVVIRKSSTNDSSSLRQWVVAADSSSFYLFISSGDSGNVYYGFGFGDIYSFKTSADSYKCIISGRNAENATAAINEGFEIFTGFTSTTLGNFMARNFAGTGTSLVVSKHGDNVKGGTGYSGSILFPNSVDNALYTSPVWVCETGSIVRGQLRGLYQPLHTITNFSDGQTFSGSLDYNGKTFLAIKQGVNGGVYLVETSNTVATN